MPTAEKKLEKEYDKMEQEFEEKLAAAKAKIEGCFGDVADKTKAQIVKYPGAAVGIAALAGLALGWLLGRK